MSKIICKLFGHRLSPFKYTQDKKKRYRYCFDCGEVVNEYL